MPQAAAAGSTKVRFGHFEADLLTQELRSSGKRIRVPTQSFQVLQLLLNNPGDLVTREQLRSSLWPADTFVDFEHGLNAAVNRLRDALHDSAERPRWIETLPKRGYRFIGTIEIPADSTPSLLEGAIAVASGKQIPLRDLPDRKRGVLPWAVFGTLAVLILAAALIAMNVAGSRDQIFARRPNPKIQALAVLPLANLSGDAEQELFADGMTEALITELGKITGPRVISRQSVMQYKGSKKSLGEIARELNVDAVLEGAVGHFGDRVKVTILWRKLRRNANSGPMNMIATAVMC
jgi:DNA-binding winged helix-turn-helix (wHTH) protein/TolB-like protein